MLKNHFKGGTMKQFLSLMLAFVFLFSISGCASIVSKIDYPVTITSNPDQATITVVNEDDKEVFRGQTPTTVTLKAGGPFFHACSYTVTFEKEGYEPQTAEIKSELDGWYIGNIIFGGLIGILIIDPLTGAMWSLDTELTVELTEKTPSAVENQVDIQIVMIDDVPDHWKSHMVKIK